MKKTSFQTFGLMTASLLLLLAFLIVWNKANYEKAQQTLNKEGNLLLQETVRELQDSTIVVFLESLYVKSDDKQSVTIKTQHTILSEDVFEKPDRFSFDHSVDTSEQTLRRITVKIDSIDTPSGLDTLIFMGDPGFGPGKEFKIVQELENQDSIIIQKFEAQLALTNLPQDYLLHEQTDSTLSTKHDEHSLRISLSFDKKITFQNDGVYLFKKIQGSLLFSLLLFGVTALAFVSFFRSNREISMYNQMKNDFIGNMTHELQTPITTVGVALESIDGLIKNKQMEKASEYLQISQHELQRLSLLVDNVLQLSVSEDHQQPLNLQKIDVAKLLLEVLQAQKIQIENMMGDYELQQENRQYSYWIMGDAVHLTNVFFNLIENSLKYTDKAPHLKFQLSTLEDRIIIQLKDNGNGIPVQYQKKVFDRFFRVPTGNQHNVKGHGLGLSYVASIVARHGGKVELRSRAGEGTIFIIQLPKLNEHG